MVNVSWMWCLCSMLIRNIVIIMIMQFKRWFHWRWLIIVLHDFFSNFCFCSEQWRTFQRIFGRMWSWNKHKIEFFSHSTHSTFASLSNVVDWHFEKRKKKKKFKIFDVLKSLCKKIFKRLKNHMKITMLWKQHWTVLLKQLSTLIKFDSILSY